MSGLRLAVVGLLVVGACQRVHPVELVPAATGGGDIHARVLSTAAANGFREFAIELSNPTSAPADIDLAAAQLELVTLLDGSSVIVPTASGGIGEPPQQPPSPSAPPRVVVGPGQAQSVWLGFSFPRDARLGGVMRREQLILPGVGTVVLDEATPDHPTGVRTYRGRRRALSLVLRSSYEVAPSHWLAYSPYELGFALQQCQLRLDVHVGVLDRFASVASNYALTSAIATGLGATWTVSPRVALYAAADYERLGIEGVPAENALVLAAGLSVPVWIWSPGNAYGTWRVPIASVRIGAVETIADSGSVTALRVGLEISPAWLW